MSEKSDDCYFYYYSTCTKGDDCPYRHCQLALGSEVTCTHWQNGKCLRPNACKYRHMESRINRSSIPCWFESQPMGCRKPHCVFLHKKPRLLASGEEQLTSAEGLILPVSTIGQNMSGSGDNNDDNGLNTNPSAKRDDSASKMKLFDDSDYLNQSLSSFNESSANIEPISISLNDCDEESDNESEQNCDPKNDNKFDYNSTANQNSGANYGIKTLEQIRMEKVFSEGDDTHIDDQCFDGFSDSHLMTQKQLKTNKDKDLRVKIKRQKFGNNNDTIASASHLNRISSNTSTETAADFGVKTLDQIRKERDDLTKKPETNADSEKGLKENQEPIGLKRRASDQNPPVVKIRRTGPVVITSLKVQQNPNENENAFNEEINENKDNCNDMNEINCEQNMTSDESSNQSNVVTSTETNSKQRIKSVDTDLDEFDLFDGESAQNIDSNSAIDDDDDELMREINQVINS